MPRKSAKSEVAFERARKVLVGGVNSPVRAFATVGRAGEAFSAAARLM
jgi:glutamate-1-semialdehyde aminotransferase